MDGPVGTATFGSRSVATGSVTSAHALMEAAVNASIPSQRVSPAERVGVNRLQVLGQKERIGQPP
jgi:hypothetical protein